jgi:nucleotide-binding universal stress UspA family protein
MSDGTTPIRRILVPHDFSDTADRALAFALDIAEKLHASVTILHAYEIPTYGFPEGPAMTVEMIGQIERASGTALEGIAQRARRPGVEVTTALRHGTAWSEINALAKEMSADLVAMGTHGRRGVARALLGSVAEKVVRTAPCPVLTVHGPEHEK